MASSVVFKFAVLVEEGLQVAILRSEDRHTLPGFLLVRTTRADDVHFLVRRGRVNDRVLFLHLRVDCKNEALVSLELLLE